MKQYSTKYPNLDRPVVHPFGKHIVDAKVQKKWDIPDKIVIKVAPTGVLMDRDQNPHQPYNTTEIRDEAIASIEAGACSIHVHVRDEIGMMTEERRYYREVIEPIRESYGDKVHFDGECAIGETFEDAMMPLTWGLLESAAVNTTATYVGDMLWGMPPSLMEAQTKAIQELNCKAQIAVYNVGDVDNADRYLIKTGIIRQPYEWIIVPALPGCHPMPNPKAMCEGLLIFASRIREVDPSDKPFIVVASGGRATNYLTAQAILLGFHVRIGMEDTVWRYPHRDEFIKSNRENVESTVEIARQLGREPATADEYRKLVGLK